MASEPSLEKMRGIGVLNIIREAMLKDKPHVFMSTVKVDANCTKGLMEE